jgi:CBS domain containing-hemolysin-like protein
MDLPDVILIVALCLIAEGFFSGSEIGIISANKIRIRHRAEAGSRSALLLEKFLSVPERMLSTTLIGTNLCTVTGAAILSGYMISSYGTAGEIYALLIFWPLTLILGEIFPKTVYQQFSDSISFKIVYPLRFFYFLFYPVMYLLTALARGVSGMVENGQGPQTPFVTKQELDLIMDMSRGEDEIGDQERVMIKRIFTFGGTTAREAMVPLVEVVAIEENDTVDELLRKVKEKGYSRIPVYRDEIYNIIGIVNVFDVLFLQPDEQSLRSIIRNVYYAPETMKVPDLLKVLQEREVPMAVVVNEYGGAIGIVTDEDLLEEIVGEIRDEHEVEEELYQELPEGGYLIEARMEVDAINEELGLKIEKGAYETLGGYLLHLLEEIPPLGTAIEKGGYSYEILEATEKNIVRVRVTPTDDKTGGEETQDDI